MIPMRLSFIGHNNPVDGYGHSFMQTSAELIKLLPGIRLIDLMDRRNPVTLSNGRRWDTAGTAVIMSIPEWLPKIGADNLLIYTMYESTCMPERWIRWINRRTKGCIVPCRWCAEVFKENGIVVPISVVPLGTATDEYTYVERDPYRKPYTFLWTGTADLRKGWDVVYRAFVKAFGESSDVRLVMHFRRELPMAWDFGDSNVFKVVGTQNRAGVRAELLDADCFVFPSRGEGWGLPPREAAATGLPTIATNWGGLAEGIAHWGLSLRVKGISTARYGGYDKPGMWAEPDGDHLVELMRWCYHNPVSASLIGRSAATYLLENNPWSQTAMGILDVTGLKYVKPVPVPVIKEPAYAETVTSN